MNSKKHAKVWDDVAEKLEMIAGNEAGDSQRHFYVLTTFAQTVAEAYRESDNARSRSCKGVEKGGGNNLQT